VCRIPDIINSKGDKRLLSLFKRKKKYSYLTGVSLTPGGVAVAGIERTAPGKPQLLFCDYQPSAGGANQQALADIVDKRGLQHAPCVSVIQPGQHTALLVEAPDVEAAELKNAMRWRIKDLIDFHIDDAVIDVFEIPGQTSGHARLMYVVATRTAVIQEQINDINNASLDLNIIDIPELVCRNITSLLPEDVDGVAFLYLTNKGGLITLTRQSVLYLARNIDADISQVTVDGDIDSNDPQVSMFLDGIVLQIQRSLDYYESHFLQPPVSSLVVAPMSRNIPGMVTYIANNLGISVRMLDVNELLRTTEPLSEAVQASCITAIGAALRIERKAL